MTHPYLNSPLRRLLTEIRPRVFVSYHHKGDQVYYDTFSTMFHDNYEAVYDRSLERLIDSTDSEYIIRRIREEYLTGTSCTLVLCGAETWQRKFVDWEIKATLDKQHSLIGIRLPTLFYDTLAPRRLLDNVYNGYAHWLTWADLIARGQDLLKAAIAHASVRPRDRIENSRPAKTRNGADW